MGDWPSGQLPSEHRPSGFMVELLDVRRGHFLLESGHHGDLWLDLDRLFLGPRVVGQWAATLAGRLQAHGVEVVCGPLVGGAFVAQLVASELDVEFAYSERVVGPVGEGLYAAQYGVPAGLRDAVRGRRVAVVDDVVNAGSAVRATSAVLQACGAELVALGALLVLGTPAARLAADLGLALEQVESLPNALWSPPDCPLCRAGTPLEDPSTD